MSEIFDVALRDCVAFGETLRGDVGVRGGTMGALGSEVGAARAEVACAGAFVSPAWVDSHIHLRSPATPGRIDPLTYGPAQGVGALIDAGSAPPARIAELIEARPWVYALANIDSRGIRGRGEAPEIGGEAADEGLARFPGRIRGIKVQASQSVLGEVALKAIKNATRVAERHGVPVMVHVGNPPPDLEAVCDLLRPGDVITHYAHGKPAGATRDDGTPLPALRRAHARGVLLDVGHGRSSFSFRRCRELLDAGIRPSIISTDLHASSAEKPVVSLARTMSKLLELGLTAAEVIAAVTLAPASAFGLEGYGGPLTMGAAANITLFRIDEREVETEDATGEKLVCGRWFQPLGCLVDGAWYEAETPV